MAPWLCVWCTSILIVLIKHCSLCGPLLHRPAVVLFNRGHSRFQNLNSGSAIDVIRMKT